MHLLVVFTGGTIGSSGTDGVLAAGAGGTRRLLQLYAQSPRARAGVTFDTIEPVTTLSENMSVEKWNRLLAALRAVDVTAYDGIIVTHGTDTLGYTAALLDWLWRGSPLPLWLVSAGLSLDDPASNGVPNFVQAVEGIADGTPGVWVAWQTAAGEQRRIPGYALRQCDLYTDEMQAAAGVIAPAAPEQPRLYALTRPLQPVVLCVRPYPGIDYAAIQPGAAVKAVLHEGYHAATAPCEGASSLPAFVARCRERGIAVYLAPVKPHAPVYQSADELRRAGVQPLSGMTFETAYARLVTAYSQPDPARWLCENAPQS